MTWKLTLTKNHLFTNEYHLVLTHLKRNCPLRQWFGPIAKQLFNEGSYNCHVNLTPEGTKIVLIDKQAAQSFLIEASFYHQKCLQQFHIASDLCNKCLEATKESSELLLYIRMTNQHPSHENLQTLVDCQIPFSFDFEIAIESLINAQLIQKVEFLQYKFYDKNPYPHNHIFDQRNITIKDYDSIERVFEHQKLIKHPVNSRISDSF